MAKLQWINEHEVSEITGRAVQTLRNDRHRRKGLGNLSLMAFRSRQHVPRLASAIRAIVAGVYSERPRGMAFIGHFIRQSILFLRRKSGYGLNIATCRPKRLWPVLRNKTHE
jgi:hypothetical protein